MAATTFDGTRKVNGNLSGGNLVFTSTGAGGCGSSRFSQVTQFYFEMTPTTVTGTPRVGISASTAPQTTDLSNGTYCLGYDATGAVKINGTTVATIATWAQGNRIDCAVNIPLQLIWFRVAGGNWNNDVIANQNPATNTGGISFATMTIFGVLQAAVSATLTGTVWTAVFSSGSFAGTPPSGYVSLDSINAAAIKVSPDLRWPAAVQSDRDLTLKGQPAAETNVIKYFMPAGPITMVSGTTKENGSLVATKKVEVYDRVTGELVNSGFSDGSGNWSLAAVGRPNVRIVSSDPTTYNSQVFDDVTPV